MSVKDRVLQLMLVATADIELKREASRYWGSQGFIDDLVDVLSDPMRSPTVPVEARLDDEA